MKQENDKKKIVKKRQTRVAAENNSSQTTALKNDADVNENITPHEVEIKGNKEESAFKTGFEDLYFDHQFNDVKGSYVSNTFRWIPSDDYSRSQYLVDNDAFRKYTRIFGDSTLDNQFTLAEEINELRRKLKKSAEELKDTQADREKKIEEFERLKAELSAKEKITHILSRISEEGRKKVLESGEFLNLFKNSNKCDAVVVSIDIRRSTELMLKARTPELFSKFITELSFKLSQIIIANFGVFDKFTGDGILAFFPKFYSGEKAIVLAIKAANECHQCFREHYNNSKDCFNVFIKDVGLGIGIDFGNVTLVNSQSELTVVGIPVVYACRFSGAKAGETLVNQPAKEEILRVCPMLASFNESEISIKNEGLALAYNVLLNEAAYNIEKPNWDELIEKYKVQ